MVRMFTAVSTAGRLRFGAGPVMEKYCSSRSLRMAGVPVRFDQETRSCLRIRYLNFEITMHCGQSALGFFSPVLPSRISLLWCNRCYRKRLDIEFQAVLSPLDCCCLTESAWS